MGVANIDMQAKIAKEMNMNHLLRTARRAGLSTEDEVVGLAREVVANTVGAIEGIILLEELLGM